jgi:arginyl-tRNA synthetase
MLAYLKQGNNTTPYTEHVKGDHFVGDYYVAFENLLKKQKKELNISEDKDTPLMQEVQDMLEKWEKKDSEVINLWKTMNTWVLEGFEETYKKLGISFDKVYYESDTYLLGKEIVQEGLEKDIFYKKKDGSVWINLNDVNLDEKLLLRANGTSVYITQDLGTIELRQKEFNPKKTIYVVGDEQEYHFKVLKNIVKKLKRDYEIYHLSYGMIDLPSGRMKSREGTVVDADDIINEMIDKVKEKTMENNKINNISIAEQDSLFEKIGLAALKFYLLKVNPKKRITFDPNKSIDFQGDTGTFILYTYVRINSILHRITNNNICLDIKDYTFLDVEKNIIFEVSKYKNIIIESVEKLDISILSQYVLGLSKMYNKFYDCCTILNEKDICKRSIRLSISKLVIRILKHSLNILGINTVDKM